MIVIVDSQIGNTGSVANALSALGKESIVSSNPDDIKLASHIILPGVGSFGVAMQNLKTAGLIEPLRRAVTEEKKPFLGICLGMQLLATRGEEGGTHEGLGLIPGITRRFNVDESKLRVPHIGWNDVVPVANSRLCKGIKNPIFYFLHSYNLVPKDESVIAGTTDYGEQFVSIIEKENIFGVQFHPEKSQHAGLALLENFLRI